MTIKFSEAMADRRVPFVSTSTSYFIHSIKTTTGCVIPNTKARFSFRSTKYDETSAHTIWWRTHLANNHSSDIFFVQQKYYNKEARSAMWKNCFDLGYFRAGIGNGREHEVGPVDSKPWLQTSLLFALPHQCSVDFTKVPDFGFYQQFGSFISTFKISNRTSRCHCTSTQTWSQTQNKKCHQINS